MVAEDWDKGNLENIPLREVPNASYATYNGSLTTLRRLQPCNQVERTLKLFLVKVPRCKHDRIHYCINECDREAIANHIFAVLGAEDAPCIVIGKLGFGLASCLKFMWRFEEQTGTKLGHQLQMAANENQELMCLFKFEKGQSIQNKIFPGNPWCLWIDIRWTSSDVSQRAAQTDDMISGDIPAQTGGISSDDTPAQTDGGSRSYEKMLKYLQAAKRREYYLELLSIADNDEARYRDLAKILLRPVVSSAKEPGASGYIDVKQTLQVLDKSFDLLRAARSHAGVDADNVSLGH